jgi:ADP-ribosylglycohydrolase
MTTSSLPADHAARLARARLALDGLSVGDAFGQRFFYPFMERSLVQGERPFPQPPWPYTDDTEMALAITQVLDQYGRIDQDELAETLAKRYWRNPGRGYGAGAHRILQGIAHGFFTWEYISRQEFGGQGSLGNGAAMRVAPVGAYFADDLARVVAEARASAEVTHAHAEGQAGAIAIAVAAAWAWRVADGSESPEPSRLIQIALDHTPPGETRQGIERALALPLEASPATAAEQLGSGERVTAPDTVPFTIWCAARHLRDYPEALWATVAGLGDRDTTCAIVGGIVVLASPPASIPEEWLAAREPLHHKV